ncbi:hypothetical protein JCM9140_1943 [Halalkalibacter wakoensis JCM 9140]|uniref:Uncharacterized protein n=1 Tax=Halalkalibacter wakoensis JCM 9140 TaxID=1236970 RepID=W4Q1J7_9BACI|nr:YhcN/YlaJ family sporulation lipoprotein [Halalkalibacter wakoensis]GAE25921.1 hypothetical protein JCM9140_1943 [Halalkalibacter wakoensis JCM 9140]
MKKIAMSVATATMLLGGLAGCGVDNQATDMGANQQTGIQAQDMRGGGAIDGRHRGEGPITDMMTPDHHRGGTIGQRTTRGQSPEGTMTGRGATGQTQLMNRDAGHRGGLFGTQGAGQTGTGGGLFGTQGAGQTGTGGGLFGTQGTGQTGTGGGLFGTQGAGQAGTQGAGRNATPNGLLDGSAQRGGRTYLNNFQTNGTGNDRGVHYTNTGRDTVGTNTGLFGTQGAQGITGRQGTQGHGQTGLTRGTARDRVHGTQGNAGMGRAGLTGGNRPGMVDEDGILRGRARQGTGALGTTHGHRRQGQGAMNLEARDRGNVNHGTATPNRQNTAGRENRTGVQQGGQRSQGTVNYHKDYDGQTVQRISQRVDRVDGVDDARVIVHDNDVVVGITADDDVTQLEKKLNVQ